MVCWRLSGHAAAVAAAAANGRQQVTARRRMGARPTDLSEAEWWRGGATATTTTTTVRCYLAVITEEGTEQTIPLPSTRDPAWVGEQGEGEAGVDGETGEAKSPTAIALTVGAAAAVEAMQAEGVTVADTEAAGEAVAAAAAAATSAAAAGSSAACRWQHNGNTIAAKKSRDIQEYNYIILID